MFPPISSGLGVAVNLVISRSTAGLTIVDVRVVLLPTAGSDSLPLIRTVLTNGKCATASFVGDSTIVSVAVDPAVRLPRFSVSLPLLSGVAPPVAETKVTSVGVAGKVSTMVTLVAFEGPLLVAVIV